MCTFALFYINVAVIAALTCFHCEMIRPRNLKTAPKTQMSVVSNDRAEVWCIEIVVAVLSTR